MLASSPRGAAVLPVALAVLTGSTAVAAAPVRHMVMAWSQDDPTCLGATELTSLVESTLARSVFHSDAPPFAMVSGSVGKLGPGRFEARIALVDMDGKILAKRTLATTGECRRLDESIALVVTLMIDGVEEEPAPLQVPAAPPRPVAPPAVETPPPPFTLTLGLGTGLSWSLLPGLVPSFGLRGEVGGRFVPVALTVRVQPPSSAIVGGVGGNFTASTGELAACPGWSNGKVRLGGCVGLGGGAIEGGSVNLLEGESSVRPILFATLLPFAAVRLAGPLWARAEAGAWFPLLRERWGYLDDRGAFDEVFRPAPVVPAATLSIEIQSGS
jgi:hypothetical protein